MNILESIVTKKRESIKTLDVGDPYSKKDVFERIPLDFIGHLKKTQFAIIAEVKKASPSKGIICADFDPYHIATTYQNNGADCMSILTENAYFQGHLEYLQGIKAISHIPLLRKDFIIDAKQVKEAYIHGADAILLIASILSDQQLNEFKKIAEIFSLQCLVEVHTEVEIERVNQLDFQLIGINNRDLKTFHTDIQTTIRLAPYIDNDCTIISESGITTAEDCNYLKNNGIQGVLIGEYFMRQNDVGAPLKKLKQNFL